MRNLPETVHAYNIPRLNVIFVLSSMVLLGCVGWILYDDYFREWKPYQRQAKVFERQKLRQDLTFADKRLEEAGYEEIKSKLAKAQEEYNQNQKQVQKIQADLGKVNGLFGVKTIEYNTAKAKLDEMKSQYDEAVEYAKGKSEIEEKLAALRKQESMVDQLDVEIQGIKAGKNEVDDNLAKFIGEKDKLDKELRRITTEKGLIEDRLWKLVHSSPLLDAPLVEFAQPTLTVRQIIADDQKYSLNFADVARIDRCITCHTFSEKKDPTPEGEEGFRFSTLPQPWKSHPRLDLFLDPNSPHSMEKFGCSTCHFGWDRGTSFTHSAHTPSYYQIKEDYVKFPLVENKAHWVPKTEIENWIPGLLDKVQEHQKLVEERERLETKLGQESRLREVRESIASLRSELQEKYGLNYQALSQVQFASLTQEEAWKKKPLEWFHMHHKMDPMRPMEFVESSCIKCHRNVTDVPVQLKPLQQGNYAYGLNSYAPGVPLNPGEKINAGMHLVGQAGCFACHKMQALETVVKHTVLTNGVKVEKEIVKANGEKVLKKDFVLPTEDLKAIGNTFKADPEEIVLRNGLVTAENLEGGRILEIPVRVPFSKPGPSLLKIATKTSKEWMYKWLENPKAFRPNTFMPQFWNLDNNRNGSHYQGAVDGPNGPVRFDWKDRNAVEMKAIVDHIFHLSEGSAYPPPPAGDAAHGEKLVNEVGCMGCHVVDQKLTDIAFRDRSYRSQGPMLHGAGSKYDAGWLYAWLRDPQQYRHNTRMPNLRLSEKEAADITAFLMTNHNDEFEKRNVPEMNREVLADTTLDYLKGALPLKQAQAKLEEMKTDEEKLEYLGAKLVERYGCMNCHNIKGLENAKPISIELTDWASKMPTKLDFGFVEIHHDNNSFLHQKLAAPRSMDRIETKRPQELMRMPQFNFTEEQIELIMTAVMGMTGEKPGKAERILNETEWNIENGRWLIKEMNCLGCHINEQRGGAIRRTVPKDENDEDQIFLFPPSLEGVGTKVRPDWLRKFVQDPGKHAFRYWLPVRMPSYHFNEDQLNVLTQYFALRDKIPYPYEVDLEEPVSPSKEQIEDGAKVVEKANCLQCHAVRPVDQALAAKNPAIDLAQVKDRMRPKGLLAWLKNPGTTSSPHPVTPGVTMPAFWTPGQPSPLADILDGDSEKQIQAVKAYLLHGMSAPSTPKGKTASK